MAHGRTQAWTSLDAAARAGARELFSRLLEAEEEGPPEALAAANEALAAAPVTVRSCVRDLLEAHRRAAGLLVETGGAARPRAVEEAPEAPRRLGPYELGEELGRGGFGVVYRARQRQPVEREVALKILRGDLVTPEVLGRFRAETRAMARLDHPGLARVLDAGIADDGRPYVVVELVSGVPITEHCERHGLSVRERVSLFAEVCHAVHHFHQRAVIHRDLKPANVLVDAAHGRARARVIDFGIAKLLGEGRDEELTRAGVILGTPKYMSPEQASGQDSGDVRTDVYALGVLLCEVLTGSVPRQGPSGESGSRASPTATRPSALAAAGPEPVAARARLLRGDLDRVVLKAVAHEPEIRYESAAAMAEDLERYLAGEPVRAVPPTRLYLARKFVGRHRVTVALSAAALLLTLASLAFAIDGRRSAIRQRNVAIAEGVRAEAVTQFLLGDMLDAMNPDTRLSERSLQALLAGASAVAEDHLGADPLLLIEVLDRVGRAQRTLTYFGEASETFGRAARHAAAVLGRSDQRTLDLRMNALVSSLSGRRSIDAGATIAAILADAQADHGPEEPIVLRARLHAAHILGGEGAAEEMEEIVRVLESVGMRATPQHLEALQYLGYVLSHERSERAVPLLEQAAELAAGVEGETSSRTVELRLALANTLLGEGRAREAGAVAAPLLERVERVFGDSNLFHNLTLLVLARSEAAEGRWMEAAGLYERQVESTAGLFGEQAEQLWPSCRELAECRLRLGDPGAAIPLLERVVSSAGASAGAQDPSARTDLATLAEARLLVGEWGRASEEAARVMASSPAAEPAYARAAAVRARALAAAGDAAGAEGLVQAALAAMREAGASAESLALVARALSPSAPPGG